MPLEIWLKIRNKCLTLHTLRFANQTSAVIRQLERQMDEDYNFLAASLINLATLTLVNETYKSLSQLLHP